MSPINVAVKVWAPHGPLLLARELGFLDGLDVDLMINEDEAEKERLFLGNQVDVLATTLDYVPFLAQSADETRFFLKLGESAGADAIIATSAIQQPQDLRGKVVALEPPGVSQLVLKEYLERHGMRYRDVVVTEVTHDETPKILANGEAAAIVTWEPYVRKALELVPGAHILMTSAELPGIIVEGLVAKSSTITRHRKALIGLAEAQFRAVEFLRTDFEQGLRRMADAFEITSDELRDMLRTVVLSGRSENQDAFLLGPEGISPLTRTYNMLARLWTSEGLVEETKLGLVDNAVISSALLASRSLFS